MREHQEKNMGSGVPGTKARDPHCVPLSEMLSLSEPCFRVWELEATVMLVDPTWFWRVT